MFRFRRGLLPTLATALFMLAMTAHAQVTPETKCSASKTKAGGKYAAALATAESKFQLTGDAPKHDGLVIKADQKLADSFAKLEMKAVDAGTTCPTIDDSDRVKKLVTEVVQGLAVTATGARFTDNGDGTITDNQTGLMWEQKGTFDFVMNYADPHDPDNVYTWTAAAVVPYPPNGTVFTDFVAKLNGSAGTCFAGKCDWRLPTMDELAGILDLTVPGCGVSNPCINPIFGDIDNNLFWTSTENDADSAKAMEVDFGLGSDGWTNTKTVTRYAFGVRKAS